MLVQRWLVVLRIKVFAFHAKNNVGRNLSIIDLLIHATYAIEYNPKAICIFMRSVGGLFADFTFKVLICQITLFHFLVNVPVNRRKTN